jgi:hypothetical protein
VHACATAHSPSECAESSAGGAVIGAHDRLGAGSERSGAHVIDVAESAAHIEQIFEWIGSTPVVVGLCEPDPDALVPSHHPNDTTAAVPTHDEHREFCDDLRALAQRLSPAVAPPVLLVGVRCELASVLRTITRTAAAARCVLLIDEADRRTFYTLATAPTAQSATAPTIAPKAALDRSARVDALSAALRSVVCGKAKRETLSETSSAVRAAYVHVPTVLAYDDEPSVDERWRIATRTQLMQCVHSKYVRTHNEYDQRLPTGV